MIVIDPEIWEENLPVSAIDMLDVEIKPGQLTGVADPHAKAQYYMNCQTSLKNDEVQ